MKIKLFFISEVFVSFLFEIFLHHIACTFTDPNQLCKKEKKQKTKS